MYDLIDRPVATLPAFEAALLGRMRRWVHALTLAGAAPPPTAAEDGFDRAMRTLDAASTETLVFQRPCHARIEETEAVVIALWRLVRDDRIGPARLAAAGLVAPAAAGTLVAAMVRAVAAPGD